MLNLHSIISWVDSHIIKYVDKILKTKNILTLICFFSFFLLFFFSPVLGIYFLIPFTIYYIYIKRYKNVCIIWGFLLFSWYLAFTACMIGFDGPLIIVGDVLGCGPKCEETINLHFYVIDRYLSLVPSYSTFHNSWNVILGGFCLQTHFLLSLLCSKLGISIYIPSLFKVLLTIFKFISKDNSPAQSSIKKKPRKSGYSYSDYSNHSPRGTFFRKSYIPKMNMCEECENFKKDSSNSDGVNVFYMQDTEEKDEHIIYNQFSRVSIHKKMMGCFGKNINFKKIEYEKFLKEKKNNN